MLVERFITIRKTEECTELHTHFLLVDAGKGKGDNEICHQHSEVSVLGFIVNVKCFIVNETKFSFSRIYLKMNHEIHVKAAKRSCSFPKYISHDMSFRLQEKFDT